jgi:large subunit ribosomal protein L18
MLKERIENCRLRRNWRSRKKVFGMPERPRLVVFRSDRHVYAQIIDDVAGLTLASASTLAKGVKDGIKKTGNKDAAAVVGSALAKRAMEVGIKAVCFDRNGYKFHGRIKSLADAARKAGLVF